MCEKGFVKDHYVQLTSILRWYFDREYEIDTFEFRSRLKPGLIPSPFALAVNNTDYAKLIKTECSHYEMLRKIEDKFTKWSPSIFIGYNSINFDEEFLRNSLFRALLDPYLTSRNNNNRADLLELLRTVDFFFPDTINIPVNNKNKKKPKKPKIIKLQNMIVIIDVIILDFPKIRELSTFKRVLI